MGSGRIIEAWPDRVDDNPVNPPTRRPIDNPPRSSPNLRLLKIPSIESAASSSTESSFEAVPRVSELKVQKADARSGDDRLSETRSTNASRQSCLFRRRLRLAVMTPGQVALTPFAISPNSPTSKTLTTRSLSPQHSHPIRAPRPRNITRPLLRSTFPPRERSSGRGTPKPKNTHRATP
jgi:hypothetical protein